MFKAFFISVCILFATFISTDADANHAGGYTAHTDSVAAYGTDVYTEVFYQGLAHIEVKGDGDTDLDCFVDDLFGNTIASDTDATDYCIVNFNVYKSGNFRVRVRNLGNVYNSYIITMQ